MCEAIRPALQCVGHALLISAYRPPATARLCSTIVSSLTSLGVVSPLGPCTRTLSERSQRVSETIKHRSQSLVFIIRHTCVCRSLCFCKRRVLLHSCGIQALSELLNDTRCRASLCASWVPGLVLAQIGRASTCLVCPALSSLQPAGRTVRIHPTILVGCL